MNELIAAVLTTVATVILFLMLIGVNIEAFSRARDKDNENHPG